VNPRGSRSVAWVALVACVACLATFAGGEARAQAGSEAPRFSVRVEPPNGEVGQLMTLLVAVDGAAGADCSLAETPQVDGGRLSLAQGPTSRNSSTVFNGRFTRSIQTEWAFRLVPERVGTLSIPPVKFTCRGKEVATQPVTVKVAPSTLPTDALSLELHASAGTLWAGQAFQIDIVATIDEKQVDKVVKNGLELDLPWLEGIPGLLRLDMPPPTGDVAQVRLAGRRDPLEMRLARDATARRLVLRRTIDMLATASGQIELPESRFSATLAMETAPDDNNPFNLFGNSMAVTKAAVVDAHAGGVVLDVRAPPSDGRPASFTNAVGRFRFGGTAAPTTLRVGDTCTLTLTLTGEGNLDFVDWPPFEELSRDFRVFGKNERKLPRTRIMEIQVSPKTVHVTEIPKLEFSAFDPEQGKYEVLTSPSFPLTVSPGGEDGLTLESRSESLSNLETIRDELPAPAGTRVPGWAWWMPAALLLIAVDLRSRQLAWRARNPQLLRRKAARAALDGSLAGAGDAHAVCVAYGRFLSARLDGPPAGLTADEAVERLAKLDSETPEHASRSGEAGTSRVHDHRLAEDLARAWGRWEASAMGGARFDLAEARVDAARLADRVEAAT
jgi:BatD DUF11 like domain